MIKLVMILRDEAHCIAQTLHSVGAWVDSFCIVDTGSTDGTPAIVRSMMGRYHNPGDVHFARFEDYAQARNVALELAEKRGPHEPFLLLLDADDVLVNGASLRACLSVSPAHITCWALPQCWPDRSFLVKRVIRPGSPWRYTGKVHEQLVHPTGELPMTLHGPRIHHTPSAIGLARSHARWPRDVVLLREHLAEHPEDELARWHLDQTLAALAHHADAEA